MSKFHCGGADCGVGDIYSDERCRYGCSCDRCGPTNEAADEREAKVNASVKRASPPLGGIHLRILRECSGAARDPHLNGYPDFAVRDLLNAGLLRQAPWHTFLVQTTDDGREELVRDEVR